MAREIVTAPPAQAPRYGLLVAAALGANDVRWTGGIKWEPEQCMPGGSGPASCADLDREPDENTGGGTSFADPFLVWAVEQCTTIGAKGRDFIGRARRALETSQSHQVAAELWSGAITKAQHADADDRTTYLAGPGVVSLDDSGGGAAQSMVDVEAVAAICSQGRRLMIHVPVWLVGHLLATQVIRIDGNALVTALGSIVVADTGYNGTGPDSEAGDSVSWIYATPLVQVYLDAVETFPVSTENAEAMASGVSWGNNTLTVWAQRLALYQVDPCCRFAIATDVPRLTVP